MSGQNDGPVMLTPEEAAKSHADYEAAVARFQAAERVEAHRVRRERIATAVLTGFMSDTDWDLSPEETAPRCLAYADALIAALDPVTP